MSIRFKLFFSILIVIFVLLQFSLLGSDGWFKYRELKQRIAVQNKENQALKKRNIQLTQEVYNLQKRLSSIEEKAREDLGMIKKDELYFRMIKKNKKNTFQHTPSSESK